jgi:hypothetical protein
MSFPEQAAAVGRLYTEPSETATLGWRMHKRAKRHPRSRSGTDGEWSRPRNGAQDVGKFALATADLSHGQIPMWGDSACDARPRATVVSDGGGGSVEE